MASVAEKMKKHQWLKAKALGEMKTEGNIKNTGIKTVAELILSVLVGGAIGSVVGRPSFLAGLGLTSAGHYLGVNWLPPVGIGMMAASNVMGVNQVSGTGLSGAKNRLIAFKDSLLYRTYLDKVLPKKDESTNGIGDLSAQNQTLNEIEKQLVESAMEFRRQNGQSTAGIEDDMAGFGSNETDFSSM